MYCNISVFKAEVLPTAARVKAKDRHIEAGMKSYKSGKDSMEQSITN